VLARLDKLVATVSWIAAALLVLMLFIGPQVVAEDESKTTDEAAGAAPYASGGSSADGKALFVDNCGSCHTLEAAGTSGTVGPPLDGISLAAPDIEAIVREGRGGMPALGGRLSDEEITAVAKFVADAR
jgi:cytochrome c6